MGRPFLGDQRTLNVPHRCHCLSNQIFLFSLNRSFGLGDIFLLDLRFLECGCMSKSEIVSITDPQSLGHYYYCSSDDDSLKEITTLSLFR